MLKKFIEKFNKSQEVQIDEDAIRIKNMLENVKNELEFVHNEFDYITDDILIDSFIYEIKALNMKYQYYLKLCKQKGLNANKFESI